MSIKSHQKNKLELSLTLELLPEIYVPELEKFFTLLRNKEVLKGFRPGQVPITVIRNLYTKKAMDEVLPNLFKKQLDQYLEENNLRPIFTSPIQYSNLLFPKGSESFLPVFCDVKVYLDPDFDLTLLKKNIKVTKYLITEVSPEMLDQYIGRLLERKISLVNEQTVLNNNYLVLVYITSKEIGIQGLGVVIPADVLLPIDQDHKSLVGAQCEDCYELNIQDDTPRYIISSKMAISVPIERMRQKLDHLPVGKYTMHVKEVRRMKAPALVTPADFAHVLDLNETETKIETIAQFKEFVKNKLISDFQDLAETYFAFQAYEKIHAHLMQEFEVPSSLLDTIEKNYIQKSQKEKNLSEAITLEEEKERLKKNYLAKSLITKALATIDPYSYIQSVAYELHLNAFFKFCHSVNAQEHIPEEDLHILKMSKQDRIKHIETILRNDDQDFRLILARKQAIAKITREKTAVFADQEEKALSVSHFIETVKKEIISNKNIDIELNLEVFEKNVGAILHGEAALNDFQNSDYFLQ